ncbi:HNH endonuclease [Lysinibacillus capsici]|uniref:HNH endonuclease n=1 Tax=Lysinibacillus TaxID=400634 RepID=UPI002589CAB4|nr:MULTISPECIES: HNH endonuclease [Lysinibacillus]WPK04627.1 HNH endonuclease [Lysinibacillus capsici]
MEYKTSSEIQGLLGISRTTLHRLEKEGLPFEKLGRSKRYELSTVEYWLSSRQHGIESLVVGKHYSNDEITKYFKVGNMGGMRRSHTTNALVIISDHTKMYDDRFEVNSEGEEIIHYTGMGKKGDQDLNFAQNRTLYESNKNGIKVYLFEKFSDELGFVYRGQVRLIGEPYEEQQYGEDNILRKVYMFPLMILNTNVVIEEEEIRQSIEDQFAIAEKEAKFLSLEELAEKSRQKPARSKRKTSTISYFRNPYVSAYVKKRANGVCELCEQPAHFNDKNGKPYLECHHIEFLSQGGPDTIENCVALCVVCHKKAHIVDDPKDRQKMMEKAGFDNPLQEVW